MYSIELGKQFIRKDVCGKRKKEKHAFHVLNKQVACSLAYIHI